MNRNKIFAAAAAAAFLATTSACSQDKEPSGDSAETGQTIAKSLSKIDGMDVASGLIEQAGLGQMLEGNAAYTMFLPTDEAFANLPEGELDWLRSSEGRADLIALLRNHMLPGMVGQNDLEAAMKTAGGTVQMANLADSTLTLRRAGDAVFIGDSEDGPKVSLPPHIATNGVVYKISAIIPPAG